MGVVNNFSRIIGPLSTKILKGSSVSISHKLFTELGLVHFNHGVGTLMPFLLKSLRKLEGIVREEMKEISALEFVLPVLTCSDIFEKSERLNLPHLFRISSKNDKSYVLSPTCEEAVAHLLQSYDYLCSKNLPIRLYQISNKFRNEMRPRSGLMRSNEFLMKDLYCFDPDEESCEQCYQEVINQYHHFFQFIKVPYICVEGSTGDIGGLKSHEFHFLTEAGQDRLVLCKNCGHNENWEMTAENSKDKCRICQSHDIKITNGIEVGHAFKLGTRFTKPFKVKYLNNERSHEFVQMSSFGLGLTRILAACVDVLAQSNEIKLPVAIAPYLVCIQPPKAGSKEEAIAKDLPLHIYQQLNHSFKDDIIVDDRTHETIGKRLISSKKYGFPFQVVLGRSVLDNPPTVEVMDMNNESLDFVQVPDINQFILNKLAGDSGLENRREKLIT